MADATAPMQLSVMPLQHTKVLSGSLQGSSHCLGMLVPGPILMLCQQVVHLIRHGEGFHNIGLHHVDAQLTPTGWQQAAALGHHLRLHSNALSIQVSLCPQRPAGPC